MSGLVVGWGSEVRRETKTQKGKGGVGRGQMGRHKDPCLRSFPVYTYEDDLQKPYRLLRSPLLECFMLLNAPLQPATHFYVVPAHLISDPTWTSCRSPAAKLFCKVLSR